MIFNNVSTNKYNDLKESKDISSISAIDILTVNIPQKKGDPKTLTISEFDDLNQDIFSYSIVKESYPESSSEIMIQDISNYYLDKDYKIGDDIEFNIEGKQKTYEIKGFFTSDLSDTKNTALSAVTIKDSEVSDSSNIYVDFKNHINIKKRAANISDLYQINILKYNEEMMSLYGQSDLTSNITLLIFLCCCLLILFSQLIIKNTIHMSVL